LASKSFPSDESSSACEILLQVSMEMIRMDKNTTVFSKTCRNILY